MTALRAKARNSGVYLRVLKNTLARRAVIRTPFESLAERRKSCEKQTLAGATASVPALRQPAGGGVADATEEMPESSVILNSSGGNKENVNKVVRAVTGLGLKDAKALVDGAPKPIKEA